MNMPPWIPVLIFLIQETLQLLVKSLCRETHNIVERAVQPGDADIADPLLDSVCSSLVERLEVVDVVVYLTVGQIFEIDI